MTDYCLVLTQGERCARGLWPSVLNSTSILELEMRKLRELTKSCVLVEASLNPEEFLCTLGWHHRGHWFRDLQVSAETAFEAVDLAREKWLKEKCPKP
ncbi:hypothetical protein LCGC14_2905090 [marine sediment metagenome]|uniref:Uncharacterized protein n=1 Tax=marine sediment metagenome TaxID=412755 RepID=A0A0F8YF49_9ZZZZ